ncbi:MAG: TIGR03862 family flavoprotein [Cyanobacteria bacterium SZAS-4]|nr:TIGR03862 family flavoprotein [Cyanobacteria bacterium SZAS-4]
MAAEVLANAGVNVDVYEAMPTLGRKFLRAGLGGLNITHSENFKAFSSRYGDKNELLQPMLSRFKPNALREWVHQLGIETFVGTSGRVFPKEMKAAPLLRAWVHRLRSSGVRIHPGHRWMGFGDNGALRIENSDGEILIKPDAVILALGGASWPQLGSTGTWAECLRERGVEMAPWEPANCGFEVDWSDHLKENFDGAPLKAVAVTFKGLDGVVRTKRGELLIKKWGIEGGLIYSFSRRIREYLNQYDTATFYIDLVPDRDSEKVLKALARPRGSHSLSRHLQDVIGSDSLKRALLFEFADGKQESTSALAKLVKALPVVTTAPRPIEEAISSAGGVSFSSLEPSLMLKALPGVFVAGEMIDWEAPTGGYLLTACLATGRWTAKSVVNWLSENR